MSMGGRLVGLVAALRPPRRRELIGLVLLLGFAGLADSWSIVTLAAFLSRLGTGDTGQNFWLFATALVLAGGLRFAANAVLQHFGQYAARDLMVDIQRRLLSRPYEASFSFHSSDLLAIPAKIEQLVFSLVLPLLQAIGAMIATICVMAALVMIDALAALAALIAVALLYALIMIAVRTRIDRAGTTLSAAFSERIRISQDSVGGLRDFIIDGSLPAQINRFSDVASRQARAGYQISVLSALPRHAGETLGISALAVLALAYGGKPAAMLGALPALGAFALAGQRLLPMAQSLYQGWSSAMSARPLLDDLSRYLALPEPIQDSLSSRPIRFEHGIELRDVRYRYPGAVGWAIDGITLRIARGETIALTGPSGAGKSTLADLIMGLLAAQGGLFIDDVSIDPDNVASWHRLVGHVPQSPFLIDSSLAENVALSRDGPIDDHLVRRAVAMASLSALVSKWPDGVETVIGENGVRLSGGERQRIALARSIYRSAPLLVLDEPTSALDPHTEMAIRDALIALKAAGTTIVIIAHRGGLLGIADRIIWLEQGRVVDESLAIEPGVEHQDRP